MSLKINILRNNISIEDWYLYRTEY
jgi:hypothetical protein